MPIIVDLPSWMDGMDERNFIHFCRLKNVGIQTFPTLILCTWQGHAHTMYTVQSKKKDRVWQQRKKEARNGTVLTKLVEDMNKI